MTKDKEIVTELFGGVWKTPGVAKDPVIHLQRWCVMETQHGTRHLVGHNMDRWEGRASTAIQSIDPVTRTVTTLSGRVYELVGPAGYDSNGTYVWNRWAAAVGWESKEVTSEVLELFEQAEKKGIILRNITSYCIYKAFI